MNENDGFEKRFTKALSAVPEVPDCYKEITRRMKRKNAIARATWAVAASLAISLTSFLFIGGNNRQSISPEVAEELQSIYNHVSGDDIHTELVSCSIIQEDSF
jgi:hypothetical protein